MLSSLFALALAIAPSGNANERDASEPDASEPDANEPDASEPDANEPDASEPDADERDASERDASERDPSDDAPDEAERARLRGRVLTFGEREPIGGARLVFADGRESITSADDGSFTVDLPAGRHEILVRAPGFDDLKSTVQLAPRQDLELEYRLEKTLEGRRYRTVVVADRQVAVSSTTLRDEEMRSMPGARGDPLRAIGSLAGVSQLAGFLPYVVVRGASPGNTGYYLDGSRVPILFHVAIGPSVIHPYFIDSVDFYPSGAPVRLGRYVSGIIEARTRPARRDRVHGDVELRLTDAGALLEIPINRPIDATCRETKRRRRRCKKGPARGALTVAGRYSYTAAILSLVRSDAEIAYWDYQARFDHKINDRLDFTAFAFGSYDHLGQKPYDDPETGERIDPDPLVRFQFHRLDSRVRQRLRGNGAAVYAVVLGLDQAGVGGADPFGAVDGNPRSGARTNEWRVAPRADFRVPISETVAIGFGLDQELQFFRLARELSELRELGNVEDLALLFSERDVSATGLYVDVEVQRDRLEIRPGVRVDAFVQSGASPYLAGTHSITHAFGVDPRLLLRERVGPRWWLRQAAGVYHQPPSFPIPIPGVESFGFERGLQRNIQGSFGYEVEAVKDHLIITQEVYLGRLMNLQDYELPSPDDGVEVNELEDAIVRVDGWAYGLETMLRLPASRRLFGWAAYTLSRSTREFPLGGTAPSNWDQRHIVNLVLGYWIDQKWNFGGRLHYHTGRPWTAPATNETLAEAVVTRRNNARLPPFFQLDLRIERVWRWPNWQLSSALDVANATYSREIFACGAEDSSGPGAMAQTMAMTQGLAKCTPLGFRYVVPSLSVRARW